MKEICCSHKNFNLSFCFSYVDNDDCINLVCTKYLSTPTKMVRIFLGKQYGIYEIKINQHKKKEKITFDYQNERSNAILIFAAISFWFLLRIKRKTLRRNITLVFTYLVLLKIVSMKIASFELPVSHTIKFCSNKSFFTLDLINKLNKMHSSDIRFSCAILTLRDVRFRNHSMFYKIILLLSHDIEMNPGPNQITISDNTWHPFKQKGLHLLHLNVNSLLPKIEEIRHIAKSSNAGVFGITESKLDKSILDCEIDIPGYDVLRYDRDRNGGGVACYIRQDISYKIRDIFPSTIENIFVDILLPQTKPFSVGIIYRPPNQNNFLEDVNENFSKLFPELKDVFILGDININIFLNGKNILQNNKSYLSNCINLEANFKKYREFCSTFSLVQMINSPTRITTHSSSLIDHILTNGSEKISNAGVIDIGLSDHQLIFCTRKLIRSKPNFHKTIKCRSFKNYTSEKLILKLNESNFCNYESFQNIDHAYNNFSDKLLKAINHVAPTKENRIINQSEEWFDGEVLEAILSRDKLLKKFKKSRLINDEICYKRSKYFAQNLIDDKKKSFFETRLKENIGKPKELWKNLKKIGLPKKVTSKSTNICLMNNNTLSFDLQKNVNIFKEFYTNIAKDLSNKLPIAKNIFNAQSLSKYYEKYHIERNSFKFSNVTEESVLKILKDIDPTKAAGMDNISGRFIKDAAPVLAKPITQLCNLSIKLSSFPTRCKIAKIKPIYKKGSKIDPQNYRPISLLPLISKIFEKVIHDQTQNYITKNKILYALQSGFRSKYSTNSCLVYLTNLISEGFDTGLYTGMILIDLQKAFDTIDHKLLLEKMTYLGFSESTIRWFECYLSNRAFIVNINDKFSQLGKVSCGVPQGSILGPILFLLYVNDMPQAISSKLLLYADDSCLLFQHKEVKTIEQQLNKDFANLCDWFVDNKLSVHFGKDKTKSILFTSKRKLKKGNSLNILYNDIEITQYPKVSYLGCILDETLSGESMCLKVIEKINTKLRFLYRKNKFLTPTLRRMLCNAIIQPHFDYACLTWYSGLTKALKNKIQVMQNKCIRFCLSLKNLDHIGKKEFEKIDWLNTNDRFLQCICSAAFNFFHKNCPEYMTEIFHTAFQGNIDTRSSFLKLRQPFRKTNMGQNTISFLGPQQWNKLPKSIKDSGTINTFKHKLKRFFFDILEK